MTCLPAGVGASIIVLLFAPVGLPWLAWLMSVGLEALVGKKASAEGVRIFGLFSKPADTAACKP